LLPRIDVESLLLWLRDPASSPPFLATIPASPCWWVNLATRSPNGAAICLGPAADPHGHGLGDPSVPSGETWWPQGVAGAHRPGQVGAGDLLLHRQHPRTAISTWLAGKQAATAPNTSRPRPLPAAARTHPSLSDRWRCFQTLVFGGIGATGQRLPHQLPHRRLNEGWVRWLWLGRWLRAEGQLHFHPREDIAGLRESDPAAHQTQPGSRGRGRLRRWCSAQPAVSVDDTVSRLCRWRGCPAPRFWLQLSGWLIEALIKVLPIEVNAWDRFKHPPSATIGMSRSAHRALFRACSPGSQLGAGLWTAGWPVSKPPSLPEKPWP